MTGLRGAVFALGALVCVLGAANLIPMTADLVAGDAGWSTFAVSMLLTVFAGGLVLLISAGPRRSEADTRRTLATIASVWIVGPAAAAIPLFLGPYGMDATDAYFEAMSALTTTGATVMTGLDRLDPGVLIWRSLLQWLGGVGVVVTAVAILPELGVGGLQLFRLEYAATTEKIFSRTRALAAAILAIYAALTALCAFSYAAAGMTAFDALNHALTTVSTGGLSTKDASLAAFDSAAVETTAAIFMILGGLPFYVFILALRRGPVAFLRDPQIPLFLLVVSVAGGVLTIYLTATRDMGALDAMRAAYVNAISIITGTGFATAAFDRWGGFAQAMFLSFMFWGACAGSTSCSIKLFRYQVMAAELISAAKRALHPHAVDAADYGGKPIPAAVSSSVFAFFIAFVGLFWIVAAALGLLGLDPLTAISASASALANVGPALGDVAGPSGTYAPLPDGAKWILCLAMLCGRLEILPVLVLLRRRFWFG